VKIYTRKGDDGTTGLWYGGRRSKADVRIEAYGAVDEACSALGVARALCAEDADRGPEIAAHLLRLQNELFVVGAELATSPEASERLEDGTSRVTEDMVGWLEGAIDGYMDRVDLPPKFVIPGGTQLSAQLDLARATVRRAERRIAALDGAGEPASPHLTGYVNRAADLVWAMARFADVPDPELFEGRG
jgi:cob(I)alamin adenosyltransferase